MCKNDFFNRCIKQKNGYIKEKKMKKLLAFLLVLVMILSISLASCAKKPADTEEDDGDDWGNGGSSSTTTVPNGNNPDGNGDGNGITAVWTDKDDTIYTGIGNLNLRLEPNLSATVVKTEAVAGTALKRVATNGTWDKVELGENQTAYVLCAYVSAVGTDFTFIPLDADDQVELTVVGTNKFALRSTPFIPGGDYKWDNATIQSFSAANGKLKKIAVSASGNWYQVSYTGEINGKTYTGSEVLYMAKSLVTSGYVTDPSVPTGGNGGTHG